MYEENKELLGLSSVILHDLLFLFLTMLISLCLIQNDVRCSNFITNCLPIGQVSHTKVKVSILYLFDYVDLKKPIIHCTLLY